jgi:uncharacterized protein
MQFKQAGKFILNKLRSDLPAYLTYHSIDHAKDVYESAERIAKAEGMSQYEQKLLLTAALFHDSGFIKARNGHEEESCKIARHYLPGFHYQPAEIEIICGMIMATRIPQSPQNRLDEIICDADLDYLGRDDFFTLSNRLYAELCHEGLIENIDEWNREQADFMESYKYHTQTAIKLRKAKKEHYIKLVKSKI